MTALLDVALPVFGIILAGYLAGRAGLLGDHSSESLNRFVYWIALPALLFVSMAKVPVRDVLNLPFIAAYAIGFYVTFAIAFFGGRAFARDRLAAQALRAFTAAFSNTGYMGIPLFLAAWGAERVLPAVISSVFNSAIAVGTAVILIEIDLARGGGIGRVLREVGVALVKNPLVVSPFLGIAVSALGLVLPTPIANFGNLIGAAAGPCALFSLGLFLVGKPIGHQAGELTATTVLKLVVHPLVTWIVAGPVFGMPPFWTASVVLLAALPTGALAFTVAQKYGIAVERVSTAALMTTLVSVVTVSAILVLLGPDLEMPPSALRRP